MEKQRFSRNFMGRNNHNRLKLITDNVTETVLNFSKFWSFQTVVLAKQCSFRGHKQIVSNMVHLNAIILYIYMTFYPK